MIYYADHCAGTLASSRDAAEPLQAGRRAVPRHRRPLEPAARFGEEYDECDDYAGQARLGHSSSAWAAQKIFEVRRIHNDLTFIDEFLTLDFCREHKLFSFGYNHDTGYYEIESREFPKIKQRLLFNLTNMGRPIIYVTDGNYKNRGELFLEHRYQRRRAEARLRPRHAGEPVQALEAAGPHRNRARRQRRPRCRLTERTTVRIPSDQIQMTNDKTVLLFIGAFSGV